MVNYVYTTSAALNKRKMMESLFGFRDKGNQEVGPINSAIGGWMKTIKRPDKPQRITYRPQSVCV